MHIAVAAFLSLVIAATSSAFSQSLIPNGTVSKEFLRKSMLKLKKNPSTKFTKSNLNTEIEKKFIDKLNSHNFDDLFAEPLPHGDTTFTYDILHRRNFKQRRIDKQNRFFRKCRVAYVDNNKIIERRLHRVGGLKPRGLSSDYWWFSYCINVDKNSHDQHFFYFFHGVYGNPKNWKSRLSNYQIRKEWRERGKTPNWISVSMGRVGSLAEPGKSDKFINVIAPHIEKHFAHTSAKHKRKRFGMGISLGGANIANIVQRNPKFFDAAVMICPAMSVVDPFSDDNIFKDYIARTHAYRFIVSMALDIVPAAFRNKDYYYNFVDPLYTGQKNLSAKTPPIYLQVNSDDEFGFYEGGRIFAMIARSNNVKVKFREIEGGHCVLEPRSIVKFLAKHSRK